MNKKLFSALALTVALAACTKDEELLLPTENGNDAMLANRPKIGNVEIVTGSATRAAIEDGSWGALVYETNDAIGAALVDEPNFTDQEGWVLKGVNWDYATWTYADYVNGTPHKIHGVNRLFTDTKNKVLLGGDYVYVNSSPAQFYTLNGAVAGTNKIHTNYGYAYNGTSWTTEAELVEGHYMFYFPYNAANSTRMPINVEIPQVQDCSELNSAIEALYDGTSPVAVDVKFLQKPTAGEKVTVAAAPNHLFAFPQIKIKNNFNGYIYDVVYGGFLDDSTPVDETSVNPDLSARTFKAAATKAMTINKVEFVYTGAAKTLWNKATLNPSSLNTAVKGDWEANKFSSPSYTSSVVEEIKDLAFDNAHALAPYQVDAKTAAEYTHNQVFTFNVNKELAAGSEYVFHAVMPAEKYLAGELQARVYVTIDTKEYVLLKATNTPAYDGWGNFVKSDASFVPGDGDGMYAFEKPVELVRGERYPVIEYNTDSDGKTSVKTNAGKILTINLEGMSAFAVGNDAPEASVRGFEDADDFINHMSKATRGETLVEVPSAGNADLGEHEIAFKENITLDAALVEAIYNNVIYDNPEMTAMRLTETNLAIAKDVTVAETSTDDKYALTGNGKTIYVEYATGVINTDAAQLESGINEIAGGNLVKPNENGNIGIIFVTGGVTINGNTTDNFRIILQNSSSLTVNANSAAQIATNGTVTITLNKNLTNAANKFNGTTTITNKAYEMHTVAGDVNGAKVKATLKEWPASIAQATQINDITIQPVDASTTITVDQANFNVFLANTTITLGTNVLGLRSTADVDLRPVAGKVKKLTAATSATWTGTNLVVTAYDDQLENIAAVSGSSSINLVAR